MEAEKQTWYSLHKEQVKLIQFLLYHLKKNQVKQNNDIQGLKITSGHFILKFD